MSLSSSMRIKITSIWQQKSNMLSSKEQYLIKSCLAEVRSVKEMKYKAVHKHTMLRYEGHIIASGIWRAAVQSLLKLQRPVHTLQQNREAWALHKSCRQPILSKVHTIQKPMWDSMVGKCCIKHKYGLNLHWLYSGRCWHLKELQRMWGVPRSPELYILSTQYRATSLTQRFCMLQSTFAVIFCDSS